MSAEDDGKTGKPPSAGNSQPGAEIEPLPLAPEAQDVIARKLRAAYRAQFDTDVPDKLTKLLEELARKR